MLSSQHGPATPIWKYLTPWSGNPALECFSLCLIPRPWQRRAGPQLLLSFILSSSNIQITLWASSPCACTPVFSPARGLFSSLATTAVPWPRFLFLRQLFPSAGLTGSLLDNRAPSSSLPWPAVSTVWSFLIRSSVLPASQQARCCCPEVGQPRVRGNTPPLHESKTQRKTIYACVDVSTEKSFDYLQAWTRGTHTHTHTLSSEGETDEISNTVRAVFVEDHLFLPVVLLGFSSVLHLRWSFLVQARWSQSAPLPLDSCWSPLRNEHNGVKRPGGMQTREVWQVRCLWWQVAVSRSYISQLFHRTTIT